MAFLTRRLFLPFLSQNLPLDAAVCVSLAEPFIFSSFQSSSGIKTAKLISTGSNLKRQPGGSAASQLPTGGLVLSDNADVMSYETRNKVNLPG